MPNLNTPQRLLLAAAGVTILLFQLRQFSKYGIEGSGWVIAIVAGVGLMLPVLSLLQKESPRAIAASSSQVTSQMDSQKEKVVAIYTKAVTRARKLHRQLPILFDFPPLQAPELKQMNQLMISSWMQYCLAYTGSLALMAEWKRDEAFPRKAEYRVVWQMILEEMIKSEANTAKQHGMLQSYDPERSRQWATRDMNEAELAMRKFVDRLAAKLPDPDAPVVDYLMDKMNVPDQLRQTLGSELRTFTKETLAIR